MKIQAIILGISCLLISAYPCCLLDNCEDESITKPTESEGEQEECGICSPFISCGSCNGFAFDAREFSPSFHFQLLPFNNLFGQTFKSVEAEYADRVWQPPKQVIVS